MPGREHGLPWKLPTGLDWLQSSQAGRAWLSALPQVVTESAELWDLKLGQPFSSALVSLPLKAELPDGTPVVLKILFPHRESEHEGLALNHWGGDGAVRLIAEDSIRHALLIERCLPGMNLSRLPQAKAMGAFIGLLPRLWKPATGPPFRSLADESTWWASYLPTSWAEAGKPFDRALIDAALDVLNTLPNSQGDQVLLHQDLHGHNVLRAQREPWLVIDPKPLVGEREFGVAPIIRDFTFGHSGRHVRYRLDRLTSELGLDRERARLWSLAQTVAWSLDSKFIGRHAETARWLLRA